MKPTNQLTELSIKQAKPKEKQYKLTDGEGMYLRVYPNGSKYWQLQYWFDGKQRIFSLGVLPDVSLKEARNNAYNIIGEIDWKNAYFRKDIGWKHLT